MKLIGALSFSLAALVATTCGLPAADSPSAVGSPSESSTYNLSPNDLVELKVYQEDDLETKFRIAKDGNVNLPLIGTVHLGGKSVEQASKIIRDRFDQDYLVNPQVTLTVIEYAKRRFTVLGQVQKPGSFEIPNEEEVTLLQAVAMAGGYTRLANAGKITITRTLGGDKKTFVVDGKAAAKDNDTKPIIIQPDDTITVAERLF